jgi:ATP-dependent Clp protease protease subunit
MPEKEQPESDPEGTEDEVPPFIILNTPESPTDSFRKIGLYGPISEENCADVVYSLFTFWEKEEKASEEAPPVEVVISTHGGDASEMFGVYDVMRSFRKEHQLGTYGIGKVMSAGVLLLAAGSKGHRRIGKHCRVMIHSVASGHMGELHNLENELEEVQHTQQQYIKALANETKMSERQIKKVLDKKINVYFTAEEAVKYGIADEVV